MVSKSNIPLMQSPVQIPATSPKTLEPVTCCMHMEKGSHDGFCNLRQVPVLWLSYPCIYSHIIKLIRGEYIIFYYTLIYSFSFI